MGTTVMSRAQMWAQACNNGASSRKTKLISEGTNEESVERVQARGETPKWPTARLLEQAKSGAKILQLYQMFRG
jgi:hypothetical protein